MASYRAQLIHALLPELVSQLDQQVEQNLLSTVYDHLTPHCRVLLQHGETLHAFFTRWQQDNACLRLAASRGRIIQQHHR